MWRLVQDALLAGLVTAAGLAEVWVPFDSVQGDGSPTVSTIAVLLSGALLVFRRSHPLLLIGVPLIWVVTAIITGGQVQVLFFGQLIPMYIALYSAVRHAGRRNAWIVACSVFVAVVLGDVFLPALQGPSQVLFHWAVFIVVVGVGVGLRISEHRAVQAALRASDIEAGARENALRAVADERARIARELHDILAHSVSVMVVQAGAAAQALEDDPAFVRRALEVIRTTGAQSLDEVRRVVALLREDDGVGLAPQPGIAQLPELLARARDDGVAVELKESGTPVPMSPGQELSVYRVVQEALTNIRKHAPGASARIELRYAPTSVAVVVHDDGGGGEASGSGHGLVGMRERVAVYGGTMDAGPAGPGWRVHATVPVGTMP